MVKGISIQAGTGYWPVCTCIRALSKGCDEDGKPQAHALKHLLRSTPRHTHSNTRLVVPTNTYIMAHEFKGKAEGNLLLYAKAHQGTQTQIQGWLHQQIRTPWLLRGRLHVKLFVLFWFIIFHFQGKSQWSRRRV
jgi:hypothetical protein